jgi:hypothetical protein
MHTNRWNLTLALGLMLTAALACSFTTANVSKMKLGKDKDVKTESSSFGPNDTIYGIVTVSNTSTKHKVKTRLLFDDVKGQESGKTFPGTDVSGVVDGAKDVPITFTPPASGWANGSYKVEFILMDEDGSKEVDKETANLTVSGASSTGNRNSSPPANDNTEEDSNSNESGGDHDH